MTHRLFLVLAFLACVAAIAAGVWRYGYLQALDQIAARGHGDLALTSDRLGAQLQRYQELAVLLADHPVLADLMQRPDGGAARQLMLEAADKTSALEVLFAGTDGVVLASARGPVGRNVEDAPEFRRAMHGALGVSHGLRAATGKRAFTYAAPSFDAAGKVRGALIVSADMENVEWDWRGSNPAVLFTDEHGDVFISNRTELLFWQRPAGQPGLQPPGGQVTPFSSHTAGLHEVWQMGWGPYLPARAVHLVRPLPGLGLLGEALVDVAPARRLANLQAAAVAALCLAFGALLFLATERRRTLAEANAVLEARVAERTEALLQANTHLRHEVTERKEAEAALKRAQADLVQAGKLSALGQMSAGISHELNQPLMAIQSFAENGAKFLERGRPERAGENLGRIAQMTRRMGRIIQNLRAFSRQENEPFRKVDVVEVLDGVIELTGIRAKADGVKLRYRRPKHAIWVRGGEVRLGQVFLNLMTNAMDAMAQSTPKVLSIEIEQGDRLVVRFQDTGPGIATPDKMFDPFFTTKEVGASEGMGLGLSISYGIVQSFGGVIRGTNAADGGAILSVELDPWAEEQAA